MATSTFAERIRKPLRALGFGVAPATTTADSSVPLLTAGSGAPSASDPNGSFYLRTDGAPYTRGGSAWQPMGRLAYVNTAASTAITGATEAETLFDVQYSLPASALKAGTVLRIRAVGIHTATTGSETHSIILKIGSLAISTIAAIDPANNDLFYFDCLLVCRTAGASGTVVACGTQMGAGQSGAGTAVAFGLASSSLDTTGANIIGVAIDRQTTATDSDSAILNLLSVEIIG